MRWTALSLLLAGGLAAHAGPAKQPAAVPAPRPRVVEASIFKDGHVLVRQEVTAIPKSGMVALETVPAPVFGSYHPYVRTPGRRLTAVTSSGAPTTERRPVATLLELLEVNPGRRLRVVDVNGEVLEGTLAGAPLPVTEGGERGGRVVDALLAAQAETVLLKTGAGLKLLPLNRIRSMTFVGPYTQLVQRGGERVRLRLRVEPPAPGPVTVGAVYLQKGIRWVPSYRLELDGRGIARTHLQGTVINELTDLENTETRLVIGVPYLFNEHELDPIALGQRPDNLSRRFRPDAISGFGGGLGGFGGSFGGGGLCEGPDGGEASGESNTAEDLFYLPPVRLTLKKGETQLLPLRDLTLAYEDTYTVDIPFTPQEDPDRARGLTAEQRRELAAMLLEVRAKHQLRITNASDQPLTTGPASIFRENRLVSHSLVPYVPPGASALCLLGEAPEIEVRHSDRETHREDLVRPDPKEVAYTRIEFSGEVRVRNQSSRPMEVEVTRSVPGNVDTAPGAEITRLDRQQETPGTPRADRAWVNRLTGSGQVRWKVALRPGEERVLNYTWHVFRS